MFFVYILESIASGKFYIGQTSDLNSRVKRHNEGRNKYTKSYRPWKLIYWNEYSSRNQALRIEKKLKSMKKRKAVIDFVIENSFRGVAQSG